MFFKLKGVLEFQFKSKPSHTDLEKESFQKNMLSFAQCISDDRMYYGNLLGQDIYKIVRGDYTWIFSLRKIENSPYYLKGNVAEWLACRTLDLDVAGSIPDHSMLQLLCESN
ncbi:hypothetical protein ElyMa_004338700 [Elysia marginata]|uniref:C-type lectin domain-containing protein n=1 Tax=Elysia marginata TaxID=1093978 RepID=A0AAV4H2U3_9GAST|nr:hypothetical protein ElyMa_004338700 [Elysia marginata]